LKTFFVPKGAKVETVVQSEPEASSSKAKITSKPKNFKSRAMKPESGILKSKSQKNKTVVASGESKLKGVKPKVLINQKLSKPHIKVQEVKSKTSSTNLKGPIKQSVRKSEIVNTSEMPKS